MKRSKLPSLLLAATGILCTTLFITGCPREPHLHDNVKEAYGDDTLPGVQIWTDRGTCVQYVIVVTNSGSGVGITPRIDNNAHPSTLKECGQPTNAK